ncbi:hypothetical protein P154DRAFT_180955 [Amniculicola lignicola CBS 123094]|uniref:T6SS Phospholipase effector Tle1-like catalytic domain-containing protein n=1 Tax=Amniculicola lignicola CBS 123094 TaxID=1392246 RepID=A0A6A5WZ91_9PLEO|nr:hypothetical protein P154DRAFT_180955 [Amniculicola lignicola CBS 123094]
MDPRLSSHSRTASRAPSRAPAPLIIDLPAREPRDPIYVDVPRSRPVSRGPPLSRPASRGPPPHGRPPSRGAGPLVTAPPGLSGGRGMFKRLIVACDGTWLNSDNGLINGKLAIPSNVTRISRAIKPISQDGIPQIVYYHFGLGTQGGVMDRLISGATGEGLGDTVREGYSFLANNYHPGDEIFLIGFSRGAYTARSIAGLVGQVGLLTKKGLNSLPEIFKDVQHRRDERYIPKNPNVPFPNKPSADDPRYAEELERRGLTRLDIPVKAIGVWDTVGSLGLPRIGWLTKVGLQNAESKEMSFYDTKLSNCVENAFQALALDEKRTAFSPAVWEKPDGNRTTLRQVWFPGTHSNVGGGYDDQQLANITLSWMMDQLQPFLDMRSEYLFEQEDENEKYYRRNREDIRPWSFGKIFNSMSGIYAFGGGTFRTPGHYHAVDPETGRTTTRKLQNTNEYIHPSARARIRLDGPGVDDRGLYICQALTDRYKLVVDYGIQSSKSGDADVFWKLKFKDDPDATKILPEAPLWTLQRELCKRDPRTYDYIRKPPPTTRPEKVKKRRPTRPVSADFTSAKMRGANGHGHAPRQSFADDPRAGRASRRSVTQVVEKRSKSRARSMDRETEIRESLPHRREKGKAWWESRSGARDPGYDREFGGRPPSPDSPDSLDSPPRRHERSARRSSMRV